MSRASREQRACIEQTLEAFIAFERECCSGLDWQLDGIEGVLQLRIEGLPADHALFQLPQVEEVTVESMPLDIGPDATLSGNAQEQSVRESAVFELKIALKPREVDDEAG